MTRGPLNSLRDLPWYGNAQKRWLVELQRWDMFWYELLVNPHKDFDTTKEIPRELNNFKKKLEKERPRRYIYFIVSRTKLRFSLAKMPRYSLISGKLLVFVEIGSEKKRRKLTIDIRDLDTGKRISPKVSVTDGRFIDLMSENGKKITYPIHDFLHRCNVRLNIYSNVEYVGITKNPDIRPLRGHPGLEVILYRLSDGTKDILVYYNLFKVTTSAESPTGINFHVINAMTDETEVELEGKIIEKCFILYFASTNQTRNRDREESELKNSLVELVKSNRLSSITIKYESTESTDYRYLQSSRVIPSVRHVFTCKVAGGDLIVEGGSAEYDKDFLPSA